MRACRSLPVALAATMVLASLALAGCGDALQPAVTRVAVLTFPAPADHTPTIPPSLAAPALPTDPSPPPSATPSPVVVWLGPGVPQAPAQTVLDASAANPGRYALTDDPSIADVRLDASLASGTTGAPAVATWISV